MRHQKEELLKEELRFLAIETRDRLKLTQSEMAIRLEMSESSYSDIETGKYMCGTLTTVLLLAMQKDVNAVILRLKTKFSDLYEKEMQPI